jgi:hypothetical protein
VHGHRRNVVTALLALWSWQVPCGS